MLLQRATLQRGHFPTELAVEMMVMRHIGSLVPRDAAGNDHALDTSFLHQVADRSVHGGNPKPRTSALRAAEDFLRGECAVHALNGGDNGRSLLSLPVRC